VFSLLYTYPLVALLFNCSTSLNILQPHKFLLTFLSSLFKSPLFKILPCFNSSSLFNFHLFNLSSSSTFHLLQLFIFFNISSSSTFHPLQPFIFFNLSSSSTYHLLHLSIIFTIIFFLPSHSTFRSPIILSSIPQYVSSIDYLILAFR